MASMTAPTESPAATGKTGGFKLTERDRLALDRTFSIDTRALAVVRILVAGLVLFEALILEWFAYAHSNPAIDFLYRNSNLIIIPFAVMMLIGYKTRIATVLVWVIYSIPQRSELLAGGAIEMGDFITVVLLLWLTFLPLDRHLSVESRPGRARPSRYLSVASGGILFQVFVIYFSAGWLKSFHEWVIDANAMELILSNSYFETPIGTALLGYPAFLAVMSVVSYVIEVVGSLLVMIPGKTLEKRRLVVVPAFIALHVGIALTMGIGLFPFVMIAAWLLFLPSRFWDRVWSRFGGEPAMVEPTVDKNGWRNLSAGALVVIMLVSNLMTWMYYPNFEGFSEFFHDFTIYLLMYQRWAMFAVPSTLPI